MSWQAHGGAALTHLGAGALAALKSKLGLNTEDKFVDTGAATTVTTTATARLTNAVIPQGLTVNTREGASVRVSSLEYRLNFQAAAAGTPCTIRLLVVRDRDSGNNSAANVLQTPSDFNSAINNNFTALGLEMLCEEYINVGAPGAENADVTWVKTITRPDMHLRWTNADTTGSVANLVQGQVALYWLASQAGTPPTASGNSRTWYVDN
jgi:hypothetical protein